MSRGRQRSAATAKHRHAEGPVQIRRQSAVARQVAADRAEQLCAVPWYSRPSMPLAVASTGVAIAGVKSPEIGGRSQITAFSTAPSHVWSRIVADR